MVRALVIIMVATLVLAVGCFAGMVAVGGQDFARNGWIWPEKWSESGYHINISEGPDAEATTHRTLAWVGGESLQIDLPAEVTYTQGPETRVEIDGPAAILDRITFDGDRLHFVDDDRGGHALDGNLTVVITAPAVKRFVLNGSPKLAIHGYDQDSLTVELNGSGEVEGSGRARAVTVVVAGSGNADLGGVEATDATVNIAGSGDVSVKPTGSAKVVIAGSGDVSLLARPSRLEQEVGGSGKVDVQE